MSKAAQAGGVRRCCGNRPVGRTSSAVLHPEKRDAPSRPKIQGRAKINRRCTNLNFVHDLGQPIGDLRIGVRLNQNHVA